MQRRLRSISAKTVSVALNYLTYFSIILASTMGPLYLVECFINKMKQYRRISSRFDKLAVRYMGFLSFVATIIWLR